MLFEGPYLRVKTPETVDGVNLKMVNGQPVYKESHLPLSAKAALEKKNLKRPEHLRHKIEVVPN